MFQASSVLKAFLVAIFLLGGSSVWAQNENETEFALLPVYKKLIESGSTAEKIGALKALEKAEVDSPEVLDMVAIALESTQDDEVKLAAFAALSQILFADHIDYPKLAERIVPLLAHQDPTFAEKAAHALYSVGYRHDFSEEELDFFVGVLQSKDLKTISTLLWTVQALNQKDLKVLTPALIELISHENDSLREDVAYAIEESKTFDPDFVSPLCIQLDKEEHAAAALKQIAALANFKYTDQTGESFLKVLKSQDAQVRSFGAMTLGRFGKGATPLVPRLIERVNGLGEDRAAAAVSLLLLRTVVGKNDPLPALKKAYVVEATGFKKTFAVVILAFANSKDPKETELLESAVNYLSGEIKRTYKREEAQSLRSLIELISFSGAPALLLKDELLQAGESLPPDVSPYYPRMAIETTVAEWLLLQGPELKGKELPLFVEYVSSLSLDDEMSRMVLPSHAFDGAAESVRLYPHLFNYELEAYTDAFFRVIEDPSAPEDVRLFALNLFQSLAVSESHAVIPYLARLEVLKQSASEEVGKAIDQILESAKRN